MSSFSDRLADAVRRKGPLCVGIDPRWESLPKSIRDRLSIERAGPLPRAATAAGYFCTRVLELVRPYCGVVKPQAAFFELAGSDGMEAMRIVLRHAKEM